MSTAQSDPPQDASATGWEQFFWLVFNRSSVPMGLLDERRTPVAVNQALCDYVGRPADELIGRAIDADISPPGLSQFKDAWDRVIRVGDWVGNVELVRSDGVVLHSQFAARSTAVDGHRLVLGVLLDGAAMAKAESGIAGRLTKRERAVVHLLTLGLTSAEVADELTISVQTVRTHVRNAMAKTGTKTRAQLVAAALGDGHNYGADDS